MKTIEQLTGELIEQRGGSRMDSQDELLEFATRLLDKIAEQSKPVAWFCEDESTLSFAEMRGCSCVPLFAHPPKPDTEELEALRKERDNWIESAKHFCNGMEYYRDQLDACARHIGLPCFTADDGGVHPEPLRAKVAECVGDLQDQLTRCRAVMEQAVDVIDDLVLDEADCVAKANRFMNTLRTLLEDLK